MKKLLCISIFFMTALGSESEIDCDLGVEPEICLDLGVEPQVCLDPCSDAEVLEDSQDAQDPTQEYRNKKAYEAIIHDAYYEAQKYTDPIPDAWKEALEAFGYKEGDIEFYTAVRLNNFTERVGNMIVILRPNFFLYLTPAEQQAYIGLQLATLGQDVEFDVGCSHGTFYEFGLNKFNTTSYTLTALGLLALYGKEIIGYAPQVKNIVFSKGMGLIGRCFAAIKLHELFKARKGIKQFDEAQFEVIDKLGADGLLSIREKQVNWGKRKSLWIERKLNYLLGKLSLAYDPEANLELIKDYIASQEGE